MKLKHKHPYTKEAVKERFSISEAVDRDMMYAYGASDIQAHDSQISAISAKLSQVIQMLAENNHLTEDNVLKLVGVLYEKADD